MSFSATCIGGPLDGLHLTVSNPAQPPTGFWGSRCAGRKCRLARLLAASGQPDQAEKAQGECDQQRSHWFEQDPVAYGIQGAEKYRRVGVKRNVHVYETDRGEIEPGGAIFTDRRKTPVPA